MIRFNLGFFLFSRELDKCHVRSSGSAMFLVASISKLRTELANEELTSIVLRVAETFNISTESFSGNMQSIKYPWMSSRSWVTSF